MGFGLLLSVLIHASLTLYVIGFATSQPLVCSPYVAEKNVGYCILRAKGLRQVPRSDWWNYCLCQGINVEPVWDYASNAQGSIYQASTGGSRNKQHGNFKTDAPITTETLITSVGESHEFVKSEKIRGQMLLEFPITQKLSKAPAGFQKEIETKDWSNHDILVSAPSSSILSSPFNKSSPEVQKWTFSSFHRKYLFIPSIHPHESSEPSIGEILSPTESLSSGTGSSPVPSAVSSVRCLGQNFLLSYLSSEPLSSLPPSAPGTSQSSATVTKSSSSKAVAIAVPVTAVCTLLVAGVAFLLYRMFYASRSSDFPKDNDKPKDDNPLLHPSHKYHEQSGADHTVNSQVAFPHESGGKVWTETSLIKPAQVGYVHGFIKESDEATEGMGWQFGSGQWEGAIYGNMTYHSVFSTSSSFTQTESVSLSRELSLTRLGFSDTLLDRSVSLKATSLMTSQPSEPSSNAFSSIPSEPEESLSSPDKLSSKPAFSRSLTQRPPRPRPMRRIPGLSNSQLAQRLPLPPALIRARLLRASEAQQSSSLFDNPPPRPYPPTSLPTPVPVSDAVLQKVTSAVSSVDSSESVSPQPGLSLAPLPSPSPALSSSSFHPIAAPVPPAPPRRAPTPPSSRPPPPSHGPVPPPKVPLPPKISKDQASALPHKMGKNDKKDEASLPKLKPLFWDKVKINTAQSMVWDSLESGSFRVDEDMMKTLFGYAAPTTPVQKAKSQLPGEVKGPRILDAKRAQNIAIQLRPLVVTRDEIHAALSEGEGLSIEALEALLKMAPTQDEERKLRDYNGNIAELDAAERFLITTLEVPFAFQRIRDMLYRASFADELIQVKEALKILKVACNELKGSRSFRKMLEAVLKTGNRMNMGTYRGDARGFKLETLLKLSDVKSVDGKFTLLHFVIEEILRNESLRASHVTEGNQSLEGSSNGLPLEGNLKDSSDVPAGRPQIQMNITDSERSQGRDDFSGLGSKMIMGMNMELANVKRAAGFDIIALKSTVVKLSGGLQKIKDTFAVEQYDKRFSRSRNRFVSFSEDSYQSSMRTFANRSEAHISNVQDEFDEVLQMVRNVNVYFENESSKDEASLCRVFQIVKDFLALLDKACRDVSKLKEEDHPKYHIL